MNFVKGHGLALLGGLALLTCLPIYASAADGIHIAANLHRVDENHAEIERDGATYILDSYIVLFQQPYYITLHRGDGQPISLEQAEQIATEYIKPRGCTEPLVRLPKLDQHNADKSAWMIGIAC